MLAPTSDFLRKEKMMPFTKENAKEIGSRGGVATRENGTFRKFTPEQARVAAIRANESKRFKSKGIKRYDQKGKLTPPNEYDRIKAEEKKNDR